MQAGVIDSVVALASELIRQPSRGGIDSPEPVLHTAAHWLSANGLQPRYLTTAGGETLGLYVRHLGPEPGPIICLDACIDTAPFGDETRWSRPACIDTAPFGDETRWSRPAASGHLDGGRLWGRGSGDSKTGAAILAHVLRDLVRDGAIRRGGVDLLFDADEHTGRFGGVRAYLAAIECQPGGRKPDAAVLGYPGNEELIRGSRGFHRVRLQVAGRAGHSGATEKDGINAIAKLARLVATLEEAQLPTEAVGPFAFGPCVTVTEIEGGEGFSQVPDRARCSVDIRLTPGFGVAEAERWLAAVVDRCDALHASPQATRIEAVESWPPYIVAESDPLVRAFHEGGELAFARAVPLAVCGPSNIGNLLAAQGIPTICGLGVSAENVHGTDECAVLSTIPAAYRGYREGALRFLGGVS
jgi:succinyl-diaminopimelate desuccinylase